MSIRASRFFSTFGIDIDLSVMLYVSRIYLGYIQFYSMWPDYGSSEIEF